MASALGSALLALACLSPPTWSQESMSPKTDEQSLLDELTGDLFKGLEQEVREAPKSRPASPKSAPRDDGGQRRPAESALPGEDLGQASNPLMEIGRLMQLVERRLAEQDGGAQTQRQQQDILDQLAQLIEQAQQRQQGSSQESQPMQQQITARSQVDQDQRGESSPQPRDGQAADGGRTPSQRPLESDQDLREGKVDETDTVSRSELMKNVWGHLPPQVREAMLNVPTGEYLPQYAPLIELYFRRLAEQYRPTP